MKDKVKAITIDDNEEFLRQVSKEVDIKNDKELDKNIDTLACFCKENSVLAMALVQLGIPKRIIYLKNTNLDIVNKMQTGSETIDEKNYNESRILINPSIIKKEGLTEYWEACVSCLDNCGKVYRPYIIYLKYFDELGSEHLEVFEGFESTVLSHEIDHLDGILHMDVAEEVLKMNKEERKIFRQSHKYIIHSKTDDYNLLKKRMKN